MSEEPVKTAHGRLFAAPNPEAAHPGTTEAKPASRLRSGDLCPVCRQGRLDYDGLLNLSCEKCGYSLGGCFT
jgi:hypothetical protein